MTLPEQVEVWMESLGFKWGKTLKVWVAPNKVLEPWVTPDQATFFYIKALEMARDELGFMQAKTTDFSYQTKKTIKAEMADLERQIKEAKEQL